MYNRLAELEKYQCDPLRLKHFNLLVDFVKKTYASTTTRLTALLEDREITYDLLWALFKPNMVVYSTCLGTGKPRCVKYHFGEERTTNGIEYFHLECCYVDFDGKVIGETPIEVAILKFRGTKKIHTLDAFPFEYHPNKQEMKAYLVQCGRKLISLMGIRHRQYRGDAFYVRKGKPIKVPVNCRIMIDAIYFREANPNYARPRISGFEHEDLSNNAFDFFESGDGSMTQSDQVKGDGKDPTEMTEDDLILYSPTVPGFCYGNKLWGERSFSCFATAERETKLTFYIVEFAVLDVKDIRWNPASFAQLAIPSKQKEVIQALAEAHTSRGSDYTFDDFVVGKGLGLDHPLAVWSSNQLSQFPNDNILPSGLAGVGKTLTAEGISEHLQRPLYSVCLTTDRQRLDADFADLRWRARHICGEA